MRFLSALMAVGAVQAAEFGLPPVTGELAGEFRALQFPGAPALHWRAEIRPGATGGREGEVAIAGEGTELRVRVAMVTPGAATWEITGGELDAATWFPVLAPAAGLTLDGVSAKGQVKLTGRGRWNSDGVVGVVSVAWRDGELRNDSAGWSLAGVALGGEFEVDLAGGLIKSRDPLELTVRTITTRRFGARNLLVRGQLDAQHVLAVSEGRVEIAGGEMTVDPFALPLSPPVANANVHIARIGLQDVVALAPTGLADARGRVSGEVRIGWSQAKGFELGAGQLNLDRDEAAIVRLTPAPGMLTNQVPQRFDLLPAWMGPLARWLRPKDPAYEEMQAIELGRSVLQLESFGLRLTPEGDERGRTAAVRIVARPARPDSSVKQVTFDINVAGPLGAVLRMGLNQSFSLQAH